MQIILGNHRCHQVIARVRRETRTADGAAVGGGAIQIGAHSMLSHFVATRTGLFRIVMSLALVAWGAFAAPSPGYSQETKINGLMYLIQNDPADTADGLLKWETELNRRGLTALIKASKPVLEKYPELFRKLAKEGHVIMGGYAGICWDMPYDKQYQALKETKDYMEKLTGRKMLVFACMYSSYDENTVKAAQALGCPMFLRGGPKTSGQCSTSRRNTTCGSWKCRTSSLERWGRGRCATSACLPAGRPKRISRRFSRRA